MIIPPPELELMGRDPTGFPVHNRGRGLLKRWAKGVLGVEDK